MLKEKWKKSVVGVRDTKAAFEDLCLQLSTETMEDWEDEESEALNQGGDALSVYGVRIEEGNDHISVLIKICH